MERQRQRQSSRRVPPSFARVSRIRSRTARRLGTAVHLLPIVSFPERLLLESPIRSSPTAVVRKEPADCRRIRPPLIARFVIRTERFHQPGHVIPSGLRKNTLEDAPVRFGESTRPIFHGVDRVGIRLPGQTLRSHGAPRGLRHLRKASQFVI